MKTTVVLMALSLSVLFSECARADQFTVLGTAASFGVLGASDITNTGSSVISGNLGLYPGTSITGFPSGTVINGTIYSGPGPAMTAQADALAAYAYLAGLSPTETLTGEDLGGQTLTPGVYFFASSAQLTGPLTLNFEGMNDATMVFQIGSTLTTASDSSVDVINQGTDDNVYFQVGSSATLGTGSVFEGDILADTSITLTTDANITCGSAIALNGAVTLDTNAITNCSTTGGDVTPEAPPGVTPEPGGLVLLGSALAAGAAFLRYRSVAGAVSNV